MAESSDRIEKRVLLRAPIERVWRAVSDSSEFGAWFGVRFDGPFVAGERTVGRITPTTVDPEVAAQQAPYEGKTFEVGVVALEPPRRLAFRWNPYGEESSLDDAPTTLVEFELEEAEGGTLLTIRESGFDSVPLERRAKAFEANEQGWEGQLTLIRKYLDAAA